MGWSLQGIVKIVGIMLQNFDEQTFLITENFSESRTLC
jgi:hypothetical protein